MVLTQDCFLLLTAKERKGQHHSTLTTRDIHQNHRDTAATNRQHHHQFVRQSPSQPVDRHSAKSRAAAGRRWPFGGSAGSRPLAGHDGQRRKTFGFAGDQARGCLSWESTVSEEGDELMLDETGLLVLTNRQFYFQGWWRAGLFLRLARLLLYFLPSHPLPASLCFLLCNVDGAREDA